MNKNKLKILVGYHKPAYLLKNDVFVPIHLGRSLATKNSNNTQDLQWMLDNMIGDDTGNNISDLNKNFNEMTAIYWAWKNYDKIGNPEYIGFSHYRRHFLFNAHFDNWIKDIDVIDNDYMNKYGVLNVPEFSKYDFIVNKVCKDNVSVYQQYKYYHEIEDLDYVINQIEKKYPEIFPVAKKYINGKNTYFCNMFIMKKEIFFKYCEFMFDILFDFFKTNYYEGRNNIQSRMFVSERLTGIYINYLKQKKLAHREYPISFIKNTEIAEPILPLSNTNKVAIVFSVSNEFAKYFGVCLQSLIEYSDKEKKYEIFVITTDMSNDNKNKLSKICPANVFIRFINPKPYQTVFALNNLYTKDYYNCNTYYRLFVADMFENFDKVIYLDSDIIIQNDILELSNIDMGENYIAATKDIFMSIWSKEEKNLSIYLKKKIKLNESEHYFQAGVLVFNIKKLREIDFSQKVAGSYKKLEMPRLLDQDILNDVCKGNVLYIDSKWDFDVNLCFLERDNNVLFNKGYGKDIKAYNELKKSNYIIHYAGPNKPWSIPDMFYADSWWNFARKTPFYEIILKTMIESSTIGSISNVDYKISAVKNYRKNILNYWKYKILSNFVFGKTRERYFTKKHLLKSKIRQAKQFRK